MLWRKVKWVCLGLLGLLIAFGVFYVCATHGFLWSIYVPIYDRLLCSIPTPPGLLSETDKVTLNPELPWGYRKYEVDKDHEETVSFFTFELPRASWDLVEHKSWSSKRREKNDKYLKDDDILFTRHQRYWLIVEIITSVDTEDVRIDNSRVSLEVYRDEELAKFRYPGSSSTPPE